MNDLDAILSDLDTRDALIDALISAGPRPLVIPSNVWTTLLVSRDPSRPDGWRVTRFDGEEAVGHVEVATFEAAVREARWYGARFGEAREA